MRIKISGWGDSLAVPIPDAYAKDLGLADGMELELAVVDGGLLVRLPKRDLSLKELVDAITPENIHKETDWGSRDEREAW